jgi:trigger factor
MPNTTRQDLGDLTAKITVTIEHSDYAKEFNQQINRFQKNGTFKGFRPGKVPVSFVKKMYGKQALVGVIDNLLQNEVNTFMQSGEYMGQPVPLDDQTIDFNYNEAKSYEFSFEIGLAPKIALNLNQPVKTKKINIEVDDEYLDKELAALRKQRTKSNSDAQTVSSPKDVIKVRLTELDGDAIKLDGISNEASLSIDLIKNKALAESLIGQSIGYTFAANYDELSEELSEERAKTYLLGLEKDENGQLPEVTSSFQAEIIQIISLEEISLSELYEQRYPDADVKGEEEFRELFRKEVDEALKRAEFSIFSGSISKELMELHPFEMPETFLKKWLVQRQKEDSPNFNEEEFDKSFANTIQYLKWRELRTAILTAYDVEITAQEVKYEVMDIFANYGFGRDMALLENLAEQFMQDSSSKESKEILQRAEESAEENAIARLMANVLPLETVSMTATEFAEFATAQAEERKKQKASEQESLEEVTQETETNE